MLAFMASSAPSEDLRSDRVNLWFAVGNIAALVLGVGLALVADAESSSSPLGQPSPWRENLGLALLALGIVLVVAAVVRLVRAQVLPSTQREAVGAFTIVQRHQMVVWIRRAQAAPAAMAEPTAARARAMVGRGKTALLYAGSVVLMVGVALSTTSVWWLGIALFIALVAVVALAVVRREANRAQRWLESHSAPAAGSSVAS